MKSRITGSTVYSKELITKVIKDPRWDYDMPFNEFTKLIKYYMGLSNSIDIEELPDNKLRIGTSTQSEILGQDEIDKLIKELI